MRVSSHPAQVVTPNKDKERSSRFQILEPPQKKGLLFTQVPKKDFIDLFFLY